MWRPLNPERDRQFSGATVVTRVASFVCRKFPACVRAAAGVGWGGGSGASFLGATGTPISDLQPQLSFTGSLQ